MIYGLKEGGGDKIRVLSNGSQKRTPKAREKEGMKELKRGVRRERRTVTLGLRRSTRKLKSLDQC